MQEALTMQPDERLEYLTLLSEQYPTVQSLCTEIINLRAIVNLPKGTEHFISDLHGEYEAFCHILNNGSGVLREKAEALLGGELDAQEMNELLTLIYYPEAKIAQLSERGAISGAWYARRVGQLIRLCRLLSSKYTRSKVRKAMQPAYAYILDELLHAQPDEDDNQLSYHQKILDTLIGIGGGDEFYRLAVRAGQTAGGGQAAHRGRHLRPRPPGRTASSTCWLRITPWMYSGGNHDVIWMGAACGNETCIASVVRTCLLYGKHGNPRKGLRHQPAAAEPVRAARLRHATAGRGAGARGGGADVQAGGAADSGGDRNTAWRQGCCSRKSRAGRIRYGWMARPMRWKPLSLPTVDPAILMP